MKFIVLELVLLVLVVVLLPVGVLVLLFVLQDHFLPYCADPRHSGDTFFFICEEDFRLTKNDSDAMPAQMVTEAARIYREHRQEVRAQRQELGWPLPDELETSDEDIFINPREVFWMRESRGPSPADAQYTFADRTEMADEWTNSFGNFFTKRISAGVGECVPEALQDLVKISIAAAREEVGDFIWYSWEGSNRRGGRTRPMHGASMIGITAEGARKLLDLMESGALPKGHADLVLREYMETHGKEFGACFLYPSVGHFQSHISGCEAGLGWRQNDWKKGWIMEGTRKIPNFIPTHPMKNEHRHLVHFRPSGEPEWIRQVTLPEEIGGTLMWLSYDNTGPEPLDSEEDGPLSSPRDVEERAAGSAAAVRTSKRQRRQRREHVQRRAFRHWTPHFQEALRI